MINHLTSETHSVVTPFLPFTCPFACGTLQLLSPFKSAIKSKSSPIVSSTDLLHLLQKKKRKERKKIKENKKANPQKNSAVTQPSAFSLRPPAASVCV